MSTFAPYAQAKAAIVGKIVERVLVSEGEHTLYLVTNAGTLEMATGADCCSESWWADAVGVKQLIGFVVRSIEEIEVPQVEDNRSRQEYDQVYGYRVTTSGGACDLIFRNSSNGYYGGSCGFAWKPATKVYAITGDWSA